MDFAVTRERRGDVRFGGSVLGSGHATLRPGCAVTLIDLSNGGALVQAARPLRPGARVQLQFDRGARRFSITAHVLRCVVWALDANAGVLYRGAVKFESRCDTLWEPETRGGYAVPRGVQSDRPSEGHPIPGSRGRGDADLARDR